MANKEHEDRSFSSIARDASLEGQIGLCGRCLWLRVQDTNRGGRFYRCGRANPHDADPFARYPSLPVMSCTGFRPATDTARAGAWSRDGFRFPDSTPKTEHPQGLERERQNPVRIARMELSHEFNVEARRLLQLARSDRRAAERELANLPPERQAAVVCEAPLSIRRSLIDLLPDPESVVPLLPEAELCYTCRAIGLEDSNWLLPMATPEQVVACFDLDAWNGLSVDPARLDAWIAALADTDEETTLRAAQALDPELIAIFLRQHVDVYLKPSPQDDPDWSPPDASQTLEGQFYFVAKDPKDDLAPMLMLLHTLFRGDYWLYFRTIQAVHEESQVENEEWALRWRTGRLEDLGFPAWDRAMQIYGYIRPDRRADLPDENRALDLGDSSLPISITDLPGKHSQERSIFRAARDLDRQERSALFHALISLANRIAVADRLELGDAESLPHAIDKATRFASEGLDFIASQNSISLDEALRRAHLDRLFRIGVNLNPEEGMPPPLENPEDDPGDDPGPQDAPE